MQPFIFVHGRQSYICTRAPTVREAVVLAGGDDSDAADNPLLVDVDGELAHRDVGLGARDWCEALCALREHLWRVRKEMGARGGAVFASAAPGAAEAVALFVAACMHGDARSVAEVAARSQTGAPLYLGAWEPLVENPRALLPLLSEREERPRVVQVHGDTCIAAASVVNCLLRDAMRGYRGGEERPACSAGDSRRTGLTADMWSTFEGIEAASIAVDGSHVPVVYEEAEEGEPISAVIHFWDVGKACSAAAAGGVDVGTLFDSVDESALNSTRVVGCGRSVDTDLIWIQCCCKSTLMGAFQKMVRRIVVYLPASLRAPIVASSAECSRLALNELEAEFDLRRIRVADAAAGDGGDADVRFYLGRELGEKNEERVRGLAARHLSDVGVADGAANAAKRSRR